MAGPTIPTRLRLLTPVTADPDWADSQAVPPDLVELDDRAEVVSVTAIARDGGGLVVTGGTVDLQPISYWPKTKVGSDDGPALTQAGETDSAVPTGHSVWIDVRGARKFTMRVAGLSGLGGAATLELLWRVVR